MKTVPLFARFHVPRTPKWLNIVLGVLAVLVLTVIVASYAVDEPLRRTIERRMNERMKGYTARVAKLDFHPIGFSLDLRDVVLIQNANPDPPVMRIPRLQASVQWKEIIFGRVVADFRFVRPILYVNRTHFKTEEKDPTPINEHGWQQALEAIYPFKINRFVIDEGKVTYYDGGPTKPLELEQVNFVAENIRNIHSPERTYPSLVRVRALVFGQGRLAVDGNADFLAEPSVGMKGDVTLENLALDYFEPITRHYNLNVRKGVLSTTGSFEYAPRIKTADLKTLTVDGVDVEYVHKAETAHEERQVRQQTKEAAKESQDQPGLLLRVDELKVVKSRVAVTDQARPPGYKIFFTDVDLIVTNLSNQRVQGTSTAHLTGNFMGSGATLADVKFRPARTGPDFDLNLKIENTDLTALNDLLLAYGKFDVAAGEFSLYTELTAKNRRVTGYVKPLFSDVQVTEKEKDKDKPLGKRVYQHIVSGLSKILKNRSTKDVATRVEVSGELGSTQTSTWQAVVGVLQNAFIKAILPGFDRQVGTRVARR
jgi:hypothetical protein